MSYGIIKTYPIKNMRKPDGSSKIPTARRSNIKQAKSLQ